MSDSDNDLFVNDNRSANPNDDTFPTLLLTSYGHRRGPLQPAPDLLIDLRTLPNPPKHVRTGQTGLNKNLREWLFSNQEVRRRFSEICDEIKRRLQEAAENEESEISIGVCCELGKHRSVAVVEQLGSTQFDGWNVVVNHRDVHLKRSTNKNKREHDRQGESE